jgi:hypothetical protein
MIFLDYLHIESIKRDVEAIGGGDGAIQGIKDLLPLAAVGNEIARAEQAQVMADGWLG